jgi:hypothetical protein
MLGGGSHFGALVNVLAMGGRGSGVEEGELVAFCDGGFKSCCCFGKEGWHVVVMKMNG